MTQGVGNAGLGISPGQFISAAPSSSHLLQHSSSTGSSSFRITLLQHGLSVGCSSSLLLWRGVLCGLRCGNLLQRGPHHRSLLCLEHLLLSSFLTLLFTGLVHSFFLMCLRSILSFLKYVFAEAPPASQVGLAVSCGGFTGEPSGTSHVWA